MILGREDDDTVNIFSIYINGKKSYEFRGTARQVIEHVIEKHDDESDWEIRDKFEEKPKSI